MFQSYQPNETMSETGTFNHSRVCNICLQKF